MLSDASASRRAAHAICREILLQHDQSSKNCFVKMSRRMAEVSDTSSEDPPLGKSQIATIWYVVCRIAPICVEDLNVSRCV